MKRSWFALTSIRQRMTREVALGSVNSFRSRINYLLRGEVQRVSPPRKTRLNSLYPPLPVEEVGPNGHGRGQVRPTGRHVAKQPLSRSSPRDLSQRERSKTRIILSLWERSGLMGTGEGKCDRRADTSPKSPSPARHLATSPKGRGAKPESSSPKGRGAKPESSSPTGRGAKALSDPYPIRCD
jgi:hypothetical protein